MSLNCCGTHTKAPAGYVALSQEPDKLEEISLDGPRLHIVKAGSQLSLTLEDNGLRVEKSGEVSTLTEGVPEGGVVPYLHILSSFLSSTAQLHLAAFSPSPVKLKLWEVSFDVSDIVADAIKSWADSLQIRAYAGITPHRRLIVFINPHGGQGKAQQIWEDVIAPIFKAARCSVHLQHTGPAESPNNATTLASEVDLSAWDALVPISGDGIINELLNGLASRQDALKALRMPIAPIPGGSGNALSVNLLGAKGVVDLALAALAVIKGSPIPLDLCSVIHGDRRMFSFLSQAFGLAADLDIGTEWIRWMGDTRFTLGYLWGVLTRKAYPVEITLNVTESSKPAMVAAYNAHQASTPIYKPPALPSDLSMPIPSLAISLEDDIPLHTELKSDLRPGWHRIHAPIQILYGGKLPWVSRGSQQFPLATGRDGLIDLVVVPPRGVQESIKGLEGAERGAFLSSPSCYYYKVSSYTCRPIGSATKGYISIDGEAIPNEEFHVECHAGLARVMSLHGRWKGLDEVVLE